MAGVEYRLGHEAAVAILPKKKVGKEVAIGPKIDHREYLRSANIGPHSNRFGANTFATLETLDGGTELFTVPTSAYVEGPNSMHAMLVSTTRNGRGREKSIPSFIDYSAEQGQAHFGLIADTAKAMTARYGTNWYIGTSISPDEWMRQAVQSIKTIHTHIVGMDGEVLIPFKEISPKERAERRKTLADSGTSLGIALMRELVFTPDLWEDPAVAGLVSEKDIHIDAMYPKGFAFALPNAEAIGDPRFFTLTRNTDERIRAEYKELAEVFTEKGARDPLKRRVLLSPEERQMRLKGYSRRKNLHIGTYLRLQAIAPLFRSAIEEIGLAGDNVDQQIYKANTRLFLNGRAYNHMILPEENGSGRIIVSIVPRSLSGGSPLDAMGIYKDQYLADNSTVERVSRRQKDVAKKVLAPVIGNY